jgi:eukaryotic-like serine/threonine-protein kinase
MVSEGNPGEVLGGKYRIERVIGRGGMGVVVAARHVTLHQTVAIKLLPDDQAKDAENVARFLREARAVVRLKSEHAIKVTDVGRRKSGAPYFVMELLEGEDLDAIITRGPLRVSDVVDWILQACEAVAEAHALGIIHRDLKPRNLFLAKRVNGKSLVKVLDFGLAKPVSAFGDAKLTKTTTVLGSPQYMSPEQMRSLRDVDHRTDVWSLGVCLYELLTRRMPFEADTVPVLCALVLKDQPKPVNLHRPDVPEALAQIVARCLEKDPAARFADIQQLAYALEPFGSSESRGASTRIAGVLRAVPPASVPPGETTATMRAGVEADERSRQGIIIAVVSSALVLGVTGAILIALYFTRTNDAQRGELPERAPTGIASSKRSPLVTQSTPVKAATSPPETPIAPPAAVPVQSKSAAPSPADSAKPAARF